VPRVIEIRLEQFRQLFNSLDPSPFRERDLDERAEEYIVSWARELPAREPIQIVVHLPQAEAEAAADHGIQMAISHYFQDRAEMAAREVREELRLGRRYLWVGLPILAGCLALSQIARQVIEAEGLAYLAQESLIIFGWVACWKAIETLLYEWLPVKRRLDLFRRLAVAEVVVRAR
jgi:hypothetical protein